jgi:hypothetical protein
MDGNRCVPVSGLVFVYVPHYSRSHYSNRHHFDKVGQHACHRNNSNSDHNRKHTGCRNNDKDNAAVDRPTPILIGVEHCNVVKAYM